MPRSVLRCLSLALLLLCAACGGKEIPPPPVPAVALALEGPTLAVAGVYGDMRVSGSLERTGMVGHGLLALHATDMADALICEARLNEPPTEKGRVRGLLQCKDGRRMPVTLRNLGPDQGVGVGREKEDGDLLVFFYHPCQEEAQRRLPRVEQDIAFARSKKQRETAAGQTASE